jgi:hypothetical protein
MREIRTSGLMSGEGKRSRWPSLNATAPFLDSTAMTTPLVIARSPKGDEAIPATGDYGDRGAVQRLQRNSDLLADVQAG